MKQVPNNKFVVSIYKKCKYYDGDKNLLEVFKDIKSNKYQKDINAIRNALHQGDIKFADNIKKKLLGFTTSGTYDVIRTKNTIKSYSQIICLDFDDIPLTEIKRITKLVNSSMFTYASFISPSGQGLKVFVKIDSNAEFHTTAYNQVANFYKEFLDYDFDAKCKDIPRLCFISFDPELFLNESATIFEIKEEISKINTITQKESKQNLSTDELLDKCLKFTEQKEFYYNGNRNNFIYLFSCNANRFGIHENDTLNYCINNFDLNESEIKATVKSTYRNQYADFAKFAKFANLADLQSSSKIKIKSIEKNSEYHEDCLKKTPLIPQSVYDNLPPILFESCQVFTQERERDVYLTGALAILSGCLPNVSGLYSGNIVYPSLFSFIIAPAASGKGALKFAKTLADKYHDRTINNSLSDKKIFDEELENYKKQKAKGKLEQGQELPTTPKFKVVFIPANTSNAKIMQHLDWNEGRGIICETEADTLGQTFKNDWGSYSDMLRKSFHHEKISKSIKSEGEYIEVNNPQLSIALSGTPKQVFNIISSAEDGLFSRFIFYVFKSDAVWLDPSPKGHSINLTDFFTKQSDIVLKLVEFYEKDEMILHLSEEQWKKFNIIFGSLLDQINIFVGEDALSIVKRLGLILYRLCIIFTALRKFAENDNRKVVYCSDVDFETALLLTETYIEHSIVMYSNLPKEAEHSLFKTSQNKKKFLEALPKKFKRNEAVEMGKIFNISERSVGDFLKVCLGKYLMQPRTGYYEKI